MAAHPPRRADVVRAHHGDDQAVESAVRDEVGIDPYHLATVLDLVAVGLVHSAWRNSPVENWHQRLPIRDGDMLRINAHTTWRVREITRRWRRELPGAGPSAHPDPWTTFSIYATDRLAACVWRWLVDPARRLPTGVRLADLAGTGLGEYCDHVHDELTRFADGARHLGVRRAFWWAAAHGALACPHWWGTPTWPPLVDRFLRALDDDEDDHWGEGGGFRWGLRAEPAEVADRTRLRRLLVREPWSLDTDTAQWIVGAGIGFLRQKVAVAGPARGPHPSL